jgi:hypothetical protein
LGKKKKKHCSLEELVSTEDIGMGIAVAVAAGIAAVAVDTHSWEEVGNWCSQSW